MTVSKLHLLTLASFIFIFIPFSSHAQATNCTFTSTSTIVLYDSNQDVKVLQQILNMSSDTRIQGTSVGTRGKENVFFGSLTQKALRKFQDKYASTTTGLLEESGTFGPVSKAKLNDVCVTAPMVARPVNTVKPTIAIIRNATNLTLSAQAGSWSNNPKSFTYRWFRNGVLLNTVSTSTYTTSATDNLSSISVRVTATNEAGSSQSTSVIAKIENPVLPPTNVSKPVLGLSNDTLLSTTNGTWTNNPTSYTYEWWRAASTSPSVFTVFNNTNPTYTLTIADAGSNMKSIVTAINSGGSSRSESLEYLVSAIVKQNATTTITNPVATSTIINQTATATSTITNQATSTINQTAATTSTSTIAKTTFYVQDNTLYFTIPKPLAGAINVNIYASPKQRTIFCNTDYWSPEQKFPTGEQNSCSSSVKLGDRVILVAYTALYKSYFIGWEKICDSSSGKTTNSLSSEYCEFVVNNLTDNPITRIYSQIILPAGPSVASLYVLSPYLGSISGGSLQDPTLRIECGKANNVWCLRYFPLGTTVTLTALNSSKIDVSGYRDYEFVSWGTPLCSDASTTCTIKIDKDIRVEPRFSTRKDLDAVNATITATSTDSSAATTTFYVQGDTLYFTIPKPLGGAIKVNKYGATLNEQVSIYCNADYWKSGSIWRWSNETCSGSVKLGQKVILVAHVNTTKDYFRGWEKICDTGTVMNQVGTYYCTFIANNLNDNPITKIHSKMILPIAIDTTSLPPRTRSTTQCEPYITINGMQFNGVYVDPNTPVAFAVSANCPSGITPVSINATYFATLFCKNMTYGESKPWPQGASASSTFITTFSNDDAGCKFYYSYEVLQSNGKTVQVRSHLYVSEQDTRTTTEQTGQDANGLYIGVNPINAPGRVSFISPNQSKDWNLFRHGENNTISWQGGRGVVKVALVRDQNAYNRPDYSEIDSRVPAKPIIGWITETGTPNGSITWDGKTVCDDTTNQSTCRTVEPGNYRLFLISGNRNDEIKSFNNMKSSYFNFYENYQYSSILSITDSVTPIASLAMKNNCCGGRPDIYGGGFYSYLKQGDAGSGIPTPRKIFWNSVNSVNQTMSVKTYRQYSDRYSPECKPVSIPTNVSTQGEITTSFPLFYDKQFPSLLDSMFTPGCYYEFNYKVTGSTGVTKEDTVVIYMPDTRYTARGYLGEYYLLGF